MWVSIDCQGNTGYFENGKPEKHWQRTFEILQVSLREISRSEKFLRSNTSQPRSRSLRPTVRGTRKFLLQKRGWEDHCHCAADNTRRPPVPQPLVTKIEYHLGYLKSCDVLCYFPNKRVDTLWGEAKRFGPGLLQDEVRQTTQLHSPLWPSMPLAPKKAQQTVRGQVQLWERNNSVSLLWKNQWGTGRFPLRSLFGRILEPHMT